MQPILGALIALNLLLMLCGCSPRCPYGYFALGFNPRTGALVCAKDELQVTEHWVPAVYGGDVCLSMRGA